MSIGDSDEYYLTLPSNTSGPNNSISSWVTTLPNTLFLAGNWHVALSELIFVNSADTIPDPLPLEIYYTSGQVRKLEIPPGNYETPAKLISVLHSVIGKSRPKRTIEFTPPREFTPPFDHFDVSVPAEKNDKPILLSFKSKPPKVGSPIVLTHPSSPTFDPLSLPMEEEDAFTRVTSHLKREEEEGDVVSFVPSPSEQFEPIEMREEEEIGERREFTPPAPNESTVLYSLENVKEEEFDPIAIEEEQKVPDVTGEFSPQNQLESETKLVDEEKPAYDFSAAIEDKFERKSLEFPQVFSGTTLSPDRARSFTPERFIIPDADSNSPLVFVFDQILHRVRVVMDKSVISHIKLSKGLAYLLGFEDEIINNSRTSRYSPTTQLGTNNLFIFCDLCAFSILGDTTANQLRVIPVTSKFGSVCHAVLNPERFYECRTGVVSSIHLEIRNEYGDLVKFNWGTAIAVIHLKRK